MNRLKELEKEYKRISQKMRYIEKSLMKEKEWPTDSLRRIIRKRDRVLKAYNDSVRENKCNVLETQKKLKDTIRMEIIATKLEDLKLLEQQRKKIRKEAEKILKQLENNQQQQYWEF